MSDSLLKKGKSFRAESIPEAVSIKFNQWVDDRKRQGHDVITLSLGEAFFQLPYFSFDNLNTDKGYHYTDSQGVPELRLAISNYLSKYHNTSVNADENIIVSAGSKIIIYMCILATINPGDEVIVFEPAWLSYEHQINLAGGKTVFIPMDQSIGNIEKFITKKTRLVIFNNPNNPVGKVHSREELSALCNLCKRHELTLLVDEAYGDFVSGDKFNSILHVEPELKNVIAVNSLSKTMGMSGWRIGYAICQSEMINSLLKINQHLITCAPSILQMYVANHFDELLETTLPQAKSYDKKRKKVAELLDNAGIPYAPGSSTFYFFLDLRNYIGDTAQLAEDMLFKHDIAMVPGVAYGISAKGYLRMSIGTESIERIGHAIETLSSLLDNKSLSEIA